LQIVSVADAFARGQSANTPQLQRGDLVFVRGESPGTPGAGVTGVTGVTPGAAASGGGAGGEAGGTPGGATPGGGMVLFEGTAGPGLYAIPDGADLITALALAGGPALGADLHHTRVLSLQGDRRVSYEVDLEALQAGAPPRPFLLRD